MPGCLKRVSSEDTLQTPVLQQHAGYVLGGCDCGNKPLSNALVLAVHVQQSRSFTATPDGTTGVTRTVLTMGFGSSKFKEPKHALAGQDFHAPAHLWISGKHNMCGLLYETHGWN